MEHVRNACRRGRMARLVALAIVMMLALMVAPAQAAPPLHAPAQGWYLPYRLDGGTLFIGVQAKDTQDRNYYCIESGGPVSFAGGAAQRMADSDAARRLAWLMERYRQQQDAATHAAIGLLAHEHFDVNPQEWQRHRAVILADYPQLAQQADQLWHEAGRHVPTEAQVTSSFTQALRQGEVEVSVRNGDGQAVAGVGYTVTLHGPARFADGASSVSGVSGQVPSRHGWQATGDGSVEVSVSYDAVGVEQIAGTQDFIRPASSAQARGSAVTMEVRNSFTPSLSTVVRDTVNDEGVPVVDQVISGVRGPDDHWVPGLRLQARGWYFAVEHGQLSEAIEPQESEGVRDFLDRLAGQGFTPAAYGRASFTAPGQQISVTATVRPDGGGEYRATNPGGFGTWVWAFEREDLSDEAKRYVLDDVVSPFMEVQETNANRARVAVQSSVTEHTAIVGSELTDTITVTGFPDDHGAFKGDERFGFASDQPLAQVSVWWSGDATDPSRNDAYRPDSVEEPVADEHHRLVGTWQYPAVNGVIRVGGGVPDAHGVPLHIEADAPGWYVFVWKFAGDDRVMPSASAYNDAWERTRVVDVVQPGKPSIVTQVEPGTVNVGEPFRDTAVVTGSCPSGSYVEFTAYRPVGEGVAPGMNDTLLDAARVAVDCTRGEARVDSPEVRADVPGLVYWKASLRSGQGDVLASHDLGVKGEIVVVREERTQPLAQTGSVGTWPLAMACGMTGIGAVARCARPRRRHGRRR